MVERHNREKDRQRHAAIIGARRQERLDREEERWQVAEQARVYVCAPAPLTLPRPATLAPQSSARIGTCACLAHTAAVAIAGWKWSDNGRFRRPTRRRPTRTACRTIRSR